VLHGSSAYGLRLVGTLLEPHETLVDGVLDLDASGDIRCVGCDCGDAGGALVIDCPRLVVSPSFINLHEHLTYAGTPPLPHPGELYEHRNDWRLGEHGHTVLPFSGGATNAQVLAQELRQVMAGATSIVGSGGRRGFLRNLDATEQSEGLLPGVIRAATFPLDDARAGADGAACAFGPRPDTAKIAAASQAYVAHLGEGTDARAQAELHCALGPLALLGQNSVAVHAMALSRPDAGELAQHGASVVWSPRSNIDLYGSTAPVALLASLGVRVALGTDWLASGSMNLERELACARQYDHDVLHDYFDDFQLWRMVTENPAWALGLEGRLGALSPGLVGDVAVFAGNERDAFASVTRAAPADVRLVLRQGKPLYGANELVSAFHDGETCEELDVCGSSQRVCTSETGISLAKLRAAGEAVYPLFSCETPPNEPHCEALVNEECPAGETECEAPRPLASWGTSDADADGVPDVLDVCPRVSDPEQGDADADGRGDACDSCPLANPGLTPCPLPIAMLRAPETRLLARASVRLTDVRVTALRTQGSKGFYVEDGDHAPYSGIFVYTGSTSPKVAGGDIVTLQGYFSRYQGLDELGNVGVLARRPSSEPYAPLLVPLSGLADGSPRAESLASQLVRVEPAAVEASNPDSPKDYDETLLFGGLRLDDLLAPDLDNQYPPGTVFTSIQGVAGFSFSHRKLYPLALEDLVLP
jgi:imidazolonepropionase-like amidohydrolase